MALAIACLLGIAGCGSDAFTAEELVAELNRHGAELALGERLGDGGNDELEIHSLAFAEPPPGGGRAAADEHAGGSLLIAADDDAALAQYRRCETAASLVCFRAGNGVVIVEDSADRADLVRLGEAVRATAAG